MLLGIFYHAALSLAAGFFWMVQDPMADRSMYVFQSAVHGFRMPLFFIVSGFFTAMLWKSKGAMALVRHRFFRVLFPCLLALFSLAPLTNWVSGVAIESAQQKRATAQAAEPSNANIWAAIRKFDSEAVRQFLRRGESYEQLHPEYRITPLAWASLVGDTASVRLLLEAGCSPDIPSEDGNTPLHAAAFLGRRDIASLLIAHGANVNARSFSGETPLAAAKGDLSIVTWIAELLSLQFDLADVKAGRSLVISELERAGAIDSRQGIAKAGGLSGEGLRWNDVLNWMRYAPIFSYLWFLWFLWWFVVLFAIVASILTRLPMRVARWSWGTSIATLVVVAALTLLPTTRFANAGMMFGPDTSMSLLPMPHMFLYYGLFFLFGVLYYFADREANLAGKSIPLGKNWPWLLPFAFLVAFPVALDATTGVLGFRNRYLGEAWIRPVSIVAQVVFAWTASIGCIGFFRTAFSRERAWVRYLSDASYWLYLAHLPLVIWLQMTVVPLAWPAIWKLMLISWAAIVLLIASYHVGVRYTWIGILLNGRRTPSRKRQTAPVDIPSVEGAR